MDDEEVTPEQEAIQAAEDHLFVARVRDSWRLRHFPYLGWTVVLAPVDFFESRTVARMTWGVWYGFDPEDFVELRAHRITADEGAHERTWWTWAIRSDKLAERKIKIRRPD